MSKDIIISVLFAELLMRHPWFEVCDNSERIALVVGIATAVFIFLLFLEECWGKYQKYRKRVQKIEQTIIRLKKGAGR